MSGGDAIDYCPVGITSFYIKQIYFSILDGLAMFLFFEFSFEHLTGSFINE